MTLEKSKILSLLDETNNTTLFLLPALEIPEHILRQMGFISSFIADVNKSYKDKSIRLFALFKPKAKALFDELLLDLEDEGIVLDDYDYNDGYVVVVFRFPSRYKKDYEFFLQGKFSKMSVEYKRLFADRTSDGDYSLHFHIFKRTSNMKELLEEDLGVEIDRSDKDLEYWGIPSIERETLDIDKILKNENKI